MYVCKCAAVVSLLERDCYCVEDWGCMCVCKCAGVVSLFER